MAAQPRKATSRTGRAVPHPPPAVRMRWRKAAMAAQPREFQVELVHVMPRTAQGSVAATEAG
eukprot:358888-Chlamydomonas_euryale.AAC.2